MAKIIALSTSDIHYHNWKQFNNNGQRINVSNNILTLLFTRGDKLGVPILFGGDLFHTPKGITTKTFHNFTEQVSLFHHLRTQMWGITGNHDEDDNCSLYQAICFAFPTSFSCLDNHYMVLPNGIKVIGIPYMRRNKGLVEAIEKSSKIEGPKILLLHTELYGAPDPSGYIAEPQNFPRKSFSLFNDFDLVLAGHVHQHTKVSDNVYMIGAPNQQRKSDSNCNMGYLEIYDDFTVKFIELDNPKFKHFNEGEEHESTDDYWIEIPKVKKLKKSSEAEFKPSMSKEEMAKRYAEETGIKSPKKIRALIESLNKSEES